MIAVATFVGSFLAMEAVSYATHRWVMHGFARGWHRSHHLPSQGGLERNDLFPVCFSGLGFALFAAASAGVPHLWPVAAGVTAYGACYLFVHEVYIHHRLPVPLPGRVRYLDWLREAHADHHLSSGEPYGMLLPVVRDRRASDPAGRSDRDVLERSSSR